VTRVAFSSFKTVVCIAAGFICVAMTSAHAECPNLLGKWEGPRIVNGVSTHAKTVSTQQGITPDCSYAWAAARAPQSSISAATKAPPPIPSRR
jgi:hypothetical protein